MLYIANILHFKHNLYMHWETKKILTLILSHWCVTEAAKICGIQKYILETIVNKCINLTQWGNNFVLKFKQ